MKDYKKKLNQLMMKCLKKKLYLYLMNYQNRAFHVMKLEKFSSKKKAKM